MTHVSTLTVDVLGPLRVGVDGRPVRLTTGRLRTLLVGLAMSAGRAVSIGQLTRIVWAEKPPADPRRSLQTYTARLRAALGGERIQSVPAGWLLRADPDHVDALRFARLLDEAAAAADTDAEPDLLEGALALWRGEPFDGVRSSWLGHTERPRLLERYLAARERRVDLDVRGGAAAEPLIAELERLTAGYPLRESLWVRLISLLDRRGRPAEALRRYEVVRRRIAEELGTEPSPELRDLYTRLLAGKPANPLPRHRLVSLTPRQLPPDIAGFAGRHDALSTLDTLLAARRTGRSAAAATITGTAGVGKTALLVRWANRAAADFPDGQLYCDLRGFDPRREPLPASQAVHGFLVALGATPREIPSGLDGRVAMYRSVTAGRRLLVVLDGARGAEQVRPLLPTGEESFVVVASRSRLTGLVVSGLARPVPLGPMPDGEAREMVYRRMSRSTGHDVPGLVDEIVRLGCGLPLAMASAAARLPVGPGEGLGAVTAGRHDPGARLDLLDSGDAATSVRAAFAGSYRSVAPEAARLFRLMSLYPGRRVSLAAAASLCGIPVRHARQRLTELADAHLLVETAPGRYAFAHDLLRAYAEELAREHGPEAGRREAAPAV